MQRLIIALMLAFQLQASAQWDTAGLCLPNLKAGPVVTSTSLMAAGGLFTFNPLLHSAAVSVRDEIVYLDLPKLYFDDYAQYLPAAALPTLKLCGLESRHPFGRMLLLEGGSYLLGAGWVNALKYGVGILRTDGSSYNSFPSGHTFVAFTGAELIRREYGEEYPWMAVAGYTLATAVALMRIYHNRHWVGDVLAGAGIGIMSVTLVYWALD